MSFFVHIGVFLGSFVVCTHLQYIWNFRPIQISDVLVHTQNMLQKHAKENWKTWPLKFLIIYYITNRYPEPWESGINEQIDAPHINFVKLDNYTQKEAKNTAVELGIGYSSFFSGKIFKAANTIVINISTKATL